MKHLQVACAIIEQDGAVLCTQRSEAMAMPLKWEFPGGKIHDNELPEECLQREVREELGIAVAIVRPLASTTHRYPSFTVTLYPFVCRILSGEIMLHEHKALAWLSPEQLHQLDWAEADYPVIAAYQDRLRQ